MVRESLQLMPRKSRRELLKVGGVTAMGTLGGCLTSVGTGGRPAQNAESRASDSIVVGALEPLSGPFSSWGDPHLEGLKFAVEEVNDDGGVLGRDVELVTSDSESEPSAADTAFRRMVEQRGAIAITGPVSSDVGIRTATTAEELEVPLYLNQSGTEKVIDEDSRFTFRTGLLPAAKSMEAQAGLAADAGYSKIHAITADYAWGHSARAAIGEEFDVDVDVRMAPLDTGDFKPYIRKIPQDVEMVIASGHPPGALNIAKQLYQLDYSPEVITGSAPPPHIILNTLGEDVGRGYADYHMADFTGDAFLEVASRFAEEKGEPMGPHVTYGYVAGKLIAQAVENAGEATPRAVAEATRNIEFDTLYAEPIQYTEYGELKDQVQMYSQVDTGGPEYLPDGDYHYEAVYRTDPLAPLEP